MRRTLGPHLAILRSGTIAPLQPLLQAAFVVLSLPVLQSAFDKGPKEAAGSGRGGREVGVEKNRTEHRLDSIREQAVLVGAAAQGLAAPETQDRPHLESTRYGGQAALADQFGPDTREIPLGQGLRDTEQFVPDRQVENRVAQKLQAFIVGRLLRLLVAPRLMRQGALQQIGLPKRPPQAALKVVQYYLLRHSAPPHAGRS